MADYLINFVNNLNPNGKTGISWPQYSVSSPKLLTFLDGLTPLTITNDDYRVAAMAKMSRSPINRNDARLFAGTRSIANIIVRTS